MGLRHFEDDGLFSEPQVFITVCSVASSLTTIYLQKGRKLDKRLELNWHNWHDFHTGDIIALFDFNVGNIRDTVTHDILSSAKSSVKVKSSTGYHLTSIRWEKKVELLPPESLRDVNLGYWIAYIGERNGTVQILQTNSFRLWPTWMNDLKKCIGDLPLHSLMIPGTHDSGSWKTYDPVTCENIYVRYYICQENSVYEQLLHGIRYLDVRVAYYANTKEKFWVNHSKYPIAPLLHLLNDVKKFVQETRELVFMDFHNFPVGFDGDFSIHNQLVEFVLEELGTFLVPTQLGQNVTLNHLWAINRYVILTYAETAYVEKGASKKHKEFLWPYLIHAWGNKRKIQDLESYLDYAMDHFGNKGLFWSAMAELTPRRIDYVTKPCYGLRGFSELVNIPMTYWFQRKKWYSNAMIVSTDFHLGNNIIEMCIRVNETKKCHLKPNAIISS